MIEPERADAAGQGLYEDFKEAFEKVQFRLPKELQAGVEVLGVIPWDELNDEDKNYWRLLAAKTVEIYFTSRPGGPCNHVEYHNTGRCAEMSCSNYVNKHRAPFRQDAPLRDNESGYNSTALSPHPIHHPADFG